MGVTCNVLQMLILLPLCCQDADWYVKRHQQELELLKVGSQNMGVEYTEGVSHILYCYAVFGYLVVQHANVTQV